MALVITEHGTEVAKYMTARGVTSFVLKYRLVQGLALLEQRKLLHGGVLDGGRFKKGNSAMKNIACQLEHSVDAEVSPSFAWSWRTDIKNWDDPPAQFQLDGPFASGSWGTTFLPGQEPLRWQIRDLRPGVAFIIEVPLDGAVLSFEWSFDAVSNHRTRITQRIVLSGDNATAYVNQVQAGFGSNLPDGMRRIADAMARAERSTERRG